MAPAATSISNWRRCSGIAAISLPVSVLVSGPVPSRALAAGVCGSSGKLDELHGLDRDIAGQLAAHDRDGIRQSLRTVAAKTNVADAQEKADVQPCSCDVALLNLGLLLATAVMKLDAAGQSTKDAAEARSVVLGDTLDSYQQTLDDCAARQSRPGFATLIKLQLIEKL